MSAAPVPPGETLIARRVRAGLDLREPRGHLPAEGGLGQALAGLEPTGISPLAVVIEQLGGADRLGDGGQAIVLPGQAATHHPRQDPGALSQELVPERGIDGELAGEGNQSDTAPEAVTGSY